VCTWRVSMYLNGAFGASDTGRYIQKAEDGYNNAYNSRCID